MLASMERPVAQVAEVQRHLINCGFALRSTCAAVAPGGLAQQGWLLKTGRDPINRSQPELMALQLAALETEPQGLA